VLSTLTDHHTHPARSIAAVYAERWQVELAYYRMKVTLRGAGVVLRGQTPALARQQVWGLLVVYNALCDLATATAAELGDRCRDRAASLTMRLCHPAAIAALFCATLFVVDRVVRWYRSARRHRIGKAHAMHVIDSTDPSRVPATADTDARLVWIGLDDRGIELEIVALDLEEAASSSTSCRRACGGDHGQARQVLARTRRAGHGDTA